MKYYLEVNNYKRGDDDDDDDAKFWGYVWQI
jgi:hypothetical protein